MSSNDTRARRGGRSAQPFCARVLSTVLGPWRVGAGTKALGQMPTAERGEPLTERLLHRAPREWEPVPDYATLSFARQALSQLERSGLVEIRIMNTSPRTVHKWRLTEAGRKVLRTI